MRRVFLIFVVSYIGNVLQAADTLFLENLRKFIYSEAGYHLKKEFYTKWAPDDRPLIYLYISRTDSVMKPAQFTTDFIFFNTDKTKALEQAEVYRKIGFQTFCYETNANSSALLNSRFAEYSQDAIAFILFHEYLHNYISELRLPVPYEFNEALGDVLGNYGALKYSETTSTNQKAAKTQVARNEKIYRTFNRTISRLHKDPGRNKVINDRCSRKIQRILKKCNSFQKDRFDYGVNNAYLLKNQYYCKNYFLLKKVYLKQKSMKAFLEIMRSFPLNPAECTNYLNKYK